MDVYQEGARVILDLGSKRRDVLLGVLQAQKFAETLREFASLADKEPPELLTENWSAKVLSFDRKVAIRFFPPSLDNTCRRVRLTAEAARMLADQVEFTRQQASFGIRFQVNQLTRKR